MLGRDAAVRGGHREERAVEGEEGPGDLGVFPADKGRAMAGTDCHSTQSVFYFCLIL